jgi:transcriptional regulator with XRE-family HTH domain
VQKSFDVQLAKYLKKARGEQSYEQFSKKTGLPRMTIYRLEHGEHHITLRRLQPVLAKLKVRLSDVFPEEY